MKKNEKETLILILSISLFFLGLYMAHENQNILATGLYRPECLQMGICILIGQPVGFLTVWLAEEIFSENTKMC